MKWTSDAEEAIKKVPFLFAKEFGPVLKKKPGKPETISFRLMKSEPHRNDILATWILKSKDIKLIFASGRVGVPTGQMKETACCKKSKEC